VQESFLLFEMEKDSSKIIKARFINQMLPIPADKTKRFLRPFAVREGLPENFFIFDSSNA